MSIVNPKFRVSVYNGLEFNENPYDTNKKFSIHIPKRKDTIMDILAKHEESTRSKTERHQQHLVDRQKAREKLAASKVRYCNVGGSPAKTVNSISPTKGAEAITNFAESLDDLQTERGAELESPDSRVKSKLMSQLEMAKSMNMDPETAREIKFEDTARSYLLDQHKYSQPEVPGYSTERMDTQGNGTSRTIKSRGLSVKSGKGKLEQLFRESLYFDTRTHSMPKSALKNPVVEDILRQTDSIFKNPKLTDSIMKLKEMDLLRKNEPSLNKFKGVGKVGYVYNDYHSRSTNPGYSRNTGGNFYYR